MSKAKQVKNKKQKDCNVEILKMIGKNATRLAIHLYLKHGVMKKTPFLQFKYVLKEIEDDSKRYIKSKKASSK